MKQVMTGIECWSEGRGSLYSGKLRHVTCHFYTIYVANRLQTWPVCKQATAVTHFLNWLACFQLYKQSGPVYKAGRTVWKLAERLGSWLKVYKQPERDESCTNLPNKQPVAQTAWQLAKWFTEAYRQGKGKVVSQVSRPNQCQRGSG